MRNRLFSDVFFRLLDTEVPDSAIINPFWGNLAPESKADHLFLPNPLLRRHRITDEDGHLALIPDTLRKALTETSDPLLALARTASVEEMLDAVVSLAMEDARRVADRGKHLKVVTDFAYHSTRWRERFKSHREQLAWLSNIKSDEELLERLKAEFTGSKQGLNLADAERVRAWFKERLEHSQQILEGPLRRAHTLVVQKISEAKQIARQVTTSAAAMAISDPARKLFHGQLSAFIGDSFFYFGSRGTRFDPGPIPALVVESLNEAAELKTASDPMLVVVAHSMGGNIVLDVLSHFAPTLPIDLVITVGSQFPLFADLDMFAGFFGEERPFKRPANVARWINMYDPNDFLGYSASQLFEDIEDVPFSSGRFGVTTHVDYFRYVSFFELMARSVKALPE